ncbi:IS66 family transposase [Lacticaseibacillus songhuajiangensis]|uniref:IS66 family transposase n=1 Tax=Lacticaseibacillus songhuajiangensis TaxID=1296539 RepID=UPI000F794B20|nr:IS66 family transposase [Lacticaseibacillus songhuajiangensis]
MPLYRWTTLSTTLMLGIRTTISVILSQTGQQSEAVTDDEPQQLRKPKSTRQQLLANDLPVRTTFVSKTDEHSEHGHELKLVGTHFVREVVHRIPGRLFVEKIYEKTYKCSTCELEDGCSHIYRGNAPKALIAHSIATPSLIASILHQKCILGTPLYRQLKDWQRAGVLLSETTISNWVIKCAELVKPVYDLMRSHLMSQGFLQGDETPYQVLQEPGKSAQSKSYIWVARSITRCETPVVMYAYANTRSGKFAQNLYSGFPGVLQCDGYAGYNLLDDSITRVGCWAHVRRKFFDDFKNTKKMTLGLKLLNQMFELERNWAGLDSASRLEKRQVVLKPLIEHFWEWCDHVETLPKDRLGKALAYAQGQRVALNRVLEFGEIDLSNNASERNMKSYVIGRKNWLFSTSPKGAEANAIWMTVVETAKANGIDPRNYITQLLEIVSQLPTFAKTESLEACLPWNLKTNSSNVESIV